MRYVERDVMEPESCKAGRTGRADTCTDEGKPLCKSELGIDSSEPLLRRGKQYDVEGPVEPTEFRTLPSMSFHGAAATFE